MALGDIGAGSAYDPNAGYADPANTQDRQVALWKQQKANAARAPHAGPYRPPAHPLNFVSVLERAIHMPARNTQMMLRQRGYKVTVDGIFGPQTNSALNALKHGVSAKEWNKLGLRPGQGGNPHAFQSKAPHVNPSSNAGGGGGGGGGLPNLSSQMLALQALMAKGGQPITPAMLGKGATPLGPGLAARIAGQYDPMIASLQQQVAQQPNQARQNLADINNWMGQVMNSLASGQSAEAAQSKAAEASVGNAAAAILSSLGGAANQGAQRVANTGMTDTGTLAAIDKSQGNFNNTLGSLLAQEKSADLQRESANQQKVAADLAGQLAAAQAQKASTLAQSRMQIHEYNNQLAQQRLQQLLGIRQYNNSQQQQRLQNRMGLLNMEAGLGTLGYKQADAQARLLHETLLNKLDIRKLQSASGSIPKNARIGNPVGFFKSMVPMLGVDNQGRMGKGQSMNDLAHRIGTQLQAAGIQPHTPEYRRLGQLFISMLKTVNGNPIVPNPAWFA